jgi:hypothetical protein
MSSIVVSSKPRSTNSCSATRATSSRVVAGGRPRRAGRSSMGTTSLMPSDYPIPTASRAHLYIR